MGFYKGKYSCFYRFFKLMISCSVKKRQLPRGKFFLVKPAKATRSIFKTSYLKF